jgi:hypothetical protein
MDLAAFLPAWGTIRTAKMSREKRILVVTFHDEEAP